MGKFKNKVRFKGKGSAPVIPPDPDDEEFDILDVSHKGSNMSLDDTHLIASMSGVDPQMVRSVHTVALNSGIVQVAGTINSSGAVSGALGFCNPSITGSALNYSYPGNHARNSVGYGSDGNISAAGYPDVSGGTFPYGVPLNNGETLTLKIDTTYDLGSLVFPQFKYAIDAGAWSDWIELQKSDLPLEMYDSGEEIHLAVWLGNAQTTWTINFGASAFMKDVDPGDLLWPPHIGAAPDLTPDAWTWDAELDANLGTLYTADPVTPTGFNTDLDVTITGAGAQYRINLGLWGSSPGVLTLGDSIQVRITSGPDYDDVANAVLTVGGASAAYTVINASDPLGPPITVMAPGATWSGSGLGVFAGTPPVDETRTTAKPVIKIFTPWMTRFANNFIVRIDGGALGGIEKVEAILGDDAIFENTDHIQLNGEQGWYFKFSRAAFTSVNASGAQDVYFRATANDGTMQTRTIGPYRFFPRTSEFSGTYTVGSGYTYATLQAAIDAARAAGEEAACIQIKVSGDYEVGNGPGSMYGGNNGRFVIQTDEGVTATIKRAVLPDAPADALWAPGIDGLEFREGVTLDFENITFLDSTYHTLDNNQLATAAPYSKFHCFDGCRVINSAGRDSYHLYGLPRGGFVASPAYLIGVDMSDHPNGLAGMSILNNVRCERVLWSGPTGSNAATYVCVDDFSSSYFFRNRPAMQLKNTLAGGGDVYRITQSGNQMGLYGAPMHMLFQKNGVTQVDMELHGNLSGANHYWDGFVAQINANATLAANGWVAQTVVMFDDEIATNAWQGGTLNMTTAFQDVETYLDFHQDMFHPSGTCDQVFWRGVFGLNAGLTWLGARAGTMLRFADSAYFRDVVMFDCVNNDMANGMSGAPTSHVYIAGYSIGDGTGGSGFFGDGLYPGGNNDDYCRFESLSEYFDWSTGTISSVYPHHINNFIITTDSNTSTALASPHNSGNTVTLYGSYSLAVAALDGLYSDPTVGDMRPQNALATTLAARTHSPWDAWGTLRAVSGGGDSAGAVSKDAPDPVWPYAPAA